MERQPRTRARERERARARECDSPRVSERERESAESPLAVGAAQAWCRHVAVWPRAQRVREARRRLAQCTRLAAGWGGVGWVWGEGAAGPLYLAVTVHRLCGVVCCIGLQGVLVFMLLRKNAECYYYYGGLLSN